MAKEHHEDRLEENFNIQLERPVVYILQVQIHPLVEAQVVAVWLYLPDAGDARLHGETPSVPDVVLGYFRRKGRPRADEAHLAFEYVEELGKLVQACLS